MRYFRSAFFAVILGLFLGVLFAPFAAHAQTQPVKSKYFKADYKVDCWMILEPGTSGLASDVSNSNGWGFYLGYWCPTPVTWKRVIFVNLFEFTPKADAARVKAALAAAPGGTPAVLQAVATASAREPTGNNVAPFDALWEKALKATDATRPPDPVWVVAPNGDAPDRPAYMVENGVRTTQTIGRNAVGATCGCKRRFLEGKWCPLKEGVDYVVSLCQRVAG